MEKRYAVGISSMEEDIEVILIQATSEEEAVCLVVLQKYSWDVRNEDEYAEVETLDDLITLVLQGDILVSKPVEIWK